MSKKTSSDDGEQQSSQRSSSASLSIEDGNDNQEVAGKVESTKKSKNGGSDKKKSKKKDKDKKKNSKSMTKTSKHGDDDSVAPAALPPRSNGMATSVHSVSEIPIDEENKKKKHKKLSVARTKSGSEASSVDPKKKTVKRSQSSSVSDMSTTKMAPKVLKPSSFRDSKQAAVVKPSSLPDITEFADEHVSKPASVARLETREQGMQRKSPPKSRKEVRNQLSLQEEKLSKSQKGTIAQCPPAAKPPLPSKPGAYKVQGQSVARVESAVLSPHSSTEHEAEAKQRSSKSEPLPGLEQAPPVVSGSVSPGRGIVVAAALSSDVEANIEKQVTRRILSQAAKAQIVSMAHGASMLNAKEEARRLADLRELHKPRGVREKLFGDVRNSEVDIATSPESIRKRNFLKWTVKRNQASNLWVATVQTKQRAVEQNNVIEVERTSVSFSASTQQEAFETGLANAVPIMQPLEEHPICFVCKAKFALFRRPQHCRNCGVAVCNNCMTQWPNKMFPETFGAKTMNNVCHACDWLATSFRSALLEGNFRTALHLYATGNINVRSSLCRERKSEAMYPIHVAVLGGSLKLLKWLCLERFCPLTVTSKSSRGKKTAVTPLLTGKGRSALSIALLHQKLDIVRFLVVEAGVSLFGEKDVNTNLALANFTTVLKMLPADFFEGREVKPTAVPQSVNHESFGPVSNQATGRRPSM